MLWFHAADTLNGFDAFKRTFNATPSARRNRKSTGKPTLKSKRIFIKEQRRRFERKCDATNSIMCCIAELCTVLKN